MSMQVTNATKEKVLELLPTLQDVSKSISKLADEEQGNHTKFRNNAKTDHSTRVDLRYLQNDIHILRNAQDDVDTAIESLSEVLARCKETTELVPSPAKPTGGTVCRI